MKIIKDKRKIAKQINKLLQLNTQGLNEKEALQVPDLFEEWKPDKKYNIDKIIKYGVDDDGITQLYIVVQKHVSQKEWSPDAQKSMYKNISFSEEGHDVWVQPLGYSDAYQTGDVVSHDDILYISTVDQNTWEPLIYGWDLYEVDD